LNTGPPFTEHRRAVSKPSGIRGRAQRAQEEPGASLGASPADIPDDDKGSRSAAHTTTPGTAPRACSRFWTSRTRSRSPRHITDTPVTDQPSRTTLHQLSPQPATSPRPPQRANPGKNLREWM